MKPISEMGLVDPIQKAIGELGFLEATPIQEKAIPWKLESQQRDYVMKAMAICGKRIRCEPGDYQRKLFQISVE